MDQPVMSPLDQIKICITEGQSFVLQGGAGSGKTETLKRTVQYVAENHPEKVVVCITHTNKAVEEIVDRIGSGYEISTIHSFLNTLIKPYKRNLLRVLPELFCLPLFERMDLEAYENDENNQKAGEHERFKKLHESLKNRRFTVFAEDTDKIVGKRDYDKDPETYNGELNVLIEDLNTYIISSLEEHHYRDVSYNETPFDSFQNAKFGHDGLLKITTLLFERYPNLGKIVRDKYDCIFIDEYQDTDEQIIRSLIYNTPDENGITLGLFGDSEQAIYEDGIGSAKEIIDDERLMLIEKKDNFRCSPQVIRVVDKFRSDGLEQEVALKEIDGKHERAEDREGSAQLVYALKADKPEKPKAPKKSSSEEEKGEYQQQREKYELELEAYKAENARRLESLILYAQNHIGDHILLKLPNKSVARDAGFGNLFVLFDERYRDTREEIKKHLDRLQFGHLSEILKLFEISTTDKRAFNKLISQLKRQGFRIQTRDDKKHLHAALSELLHSDKAAYEVMSKAIQTKIISVSEIHQTYLNRKESELERIANEIHIEVFKVLRNKGCNTELQMLTYLQNNEDPDTSPEIIKEQFEERMRDIRIENFYNGLFGANLKFKEILAFYRYEDDDSNFMTMHKTKGTGIDNVLVVLDEYNWTKYDFASCFKEEDDNPSRQALTRKLLYVACSRAKKNLICARLANDAAEIEKIKLYFDDFREIAV